MHVRFSHDEGGRGHVRIVGLLLAQDSQTLRLVISVLLEKLGGKAEFSSQDLERMKPYSLVESQSALGMHYELELRKPPEIIKGMVVPQHNQESVYRSAIEGPSLHATPAQTESDTTSGITDD